MAAWPSNCSNDTNEPARNNFTVGHATGLWFPVFDWPEARSIAFTYQPFHRVAVDYLRQAVETLPAKAW